VIDKKLKLVDEVNRALCASILILSFLLISFFVKPSFAVVPRVENVVVYDVGGSTFLNITIYHTPENPSHYVNIIRVTVGTNVTEIPIGVQPLTPQNTFTITHNLGQVIDMPTALVEAHCIVDQWSAVNWQGQVPEFSGFMLPLLLMLTLSASLILAVFCKARH
jgi:hypothetical protein